MIQKERAERQKPSLMPEAGCLTPEAESRLYFAGGTYSFGLADPSPKKNISICFTMTS
jgi:hypothetical protein